MSEAHDVVSDVHGRGAGLDDESALVQSPEHLVRNNVVKILEK